MRLSAYLQEVGQGDVKRPGNLHNSADSHISGGILKDPLHRLEINVSSTREGRLIKSSLSGDLFNS